MRLMIVLAFVATLIMPLTVAKAEEPGDSFAAVISEQIAAFQRNDVAQAFTFASPTIQQIFKSPERFGRMVRDGYPMVWRPARFEMMQIVDTPSGPVQVVLFEDQSGRLHEAGYLMQMIDGRWRINGVKVRGMPGVGT
ncbi:MAG: DUF4864 domain-containing protein [Pseudomonadota bacterium]